jgi:hypothetical protein
MQVRGGLRSEPFFRDRAELGRFVEISGATENRFATPSERKSLRGAKAVRGFEPYAILVRRSEYDNWLRMPALTPPTRQLRNPIRNDRLRSKIRKSRKCLRIYGWEAGIRTPIRRSRVYKGARRRVAP